MKRTVVPIPKKSKLVLVGNGMSGYKFCEKFLKYHLYKKFDLVIYGEESRPAYDRVNLTRYFTSPGELTLAPASWYKENNMLLKTGEDVTYINRVEKWIRTRRGTIEYYDKLILATGSSPFIPAIEGLNNPHVFVYRTIDDLVAIKERMCGCGSALVIGGGILGLEAARAVLHSGLTTTIVEIANHLMPRQLDFEGAKLLQSQIEALGVKVLVDKKVIRLTGKEGGIEVGCADGATLNTDMVIIAAGITPRDDLAVSGGLTTGIKGGIVVNNYMLTSDPHISAIGECAMAHNRIWGLAAPCYEMADVLAARLANIYKVFRGDALFTKLKVLETRVAFIGDGMDADNSQRHYSVIESHAGVYKRITVSGDGKQLLGAILIGDISAYSNLLHMVRSRVRIPDDPMLLICNPQTQGKSSVGDWPEDTIICLCESVSKKTITDTITVGGIARLDQIKKMTHAGTGCESCTNVIEEIINLYKEHAKHNVNETKL
ncbi:MAG: NAD(P)/FAD-dependent oxidoreductase [Chitinophagaceae bacterium]|nr:NAD(P)/FAD-dependent oxidoreductase [Chitinophagaceae bacterium]